MYLIYGVVVVALSSCMHLNMVDDQGGARGWSSGGRGGGWSSGVGHK
ncbi:hypothetical protein [Crenobacter cavernae]|nr:hypothetical protein [Crenobacter cavernae]